MSERLSVVATWLDESGDRAVMRSDGVVMHWSAVAGEWLYSAHHHEPTEPVPGCEASAGPGMGTAEFRREYPDGREKGDDART